MATNKIEIIYDYDDNNQPIRKYYICQICGTKVPIEMDEMGKSSCNECRAIVFRKSQEKVDF